MATYMKIISITRPFIDESFMAWPQRTLNERLLHSGYSVSQYSAFIHNLISSISLHISETFNQYWVRKSN